MFSKFLRDETGATSIEYGIIAGIMGVIIVTGITLVGSGVGDIFNENADTISAATN